ncbi:hypothetical protein Aduo_000287 [Ancylostoma duodenale]
MKIYISFVLFAAILALLSVSCNGRLGKRPAPWPPNVPPHLQPKQPKYDPPLPLTPPQTPPQSPPHSPGGRWQGPPMVNGHRFGFPRYHQPAMLHLG